MEGKQTRSNHIHLLCILVKLRPSNLDHLYNLVCEIELWHFITLNLTLWPTFTFKSLAFRFRPHRCRLLYIKRWKRELLTIFCLRWAFQGPLNPAIRTASHVYVTCQMDILYIVRTRRYHLHPFYILGISRLCRRCCLLVGLIRRRLRRFCFNDFKEFPNFLFCALCFSCLFLTTLHCYNIDLGFVGRFYMVYVLDPFSANTARVYTQWKFTFISDHSFSVRYFLLKEVKEPRGFQTPMYTNGQMPYKFYWGWMGAFCKTVEPVFSELVDLEDSGSSVTVDDSFNLQ